MRWIEALAPGAGPADAQDGPAEDCVQHVRTREFDEAALSRAKALIDEHPRAFTGPPLLRAGAQAR